MNTQTKTQTSSSSQKKLLVTCALPYANGNIHIGHLVEHIQADIFVRFNKMTGRDCIFLCADDTHGTPIMVKARELGITPEALIQKSWNDHTRDFKGFDIGFDLYSSTNSQENKNLCEFFYQEMKAKNHLRTEVISQLYCEHDKMFLPDRFVKGICPNCGAKDQYGDNCDVCSATYSPADLKEPGCSICGTRPVQKPTEQFLFKVNDFREELNDFVQNNLSSEMTPKMLEWFKEPLRDWDISRNSPYFGFQIPGTTDKYFYVWVDAPMGYVSTTQQYCKQTGKSFDSYWKTDQEADVFHFIGKDITYFHSLFWPSLLKAANFRAPTKVHVHGMLTVNGTKMSKSKGTMISAESYLKHLDPSYLRYYYASKLGAGIDDLDLNLDDFIGKTNSELVGKITNLASRGATMLGKKFNSTLSAELDNEGQTLLEKFGSVAPQIFTHYSQLDFSKALAAIRDLADETNRYFDEKAPWKTVDSDPIATQKVLTTTLNAFRKLAIFLKPVLPRYADESAVLFNETNYQWSDLNKNLLGAKIQTYKMLAVRIEKEKVEALMSEQTKTEAPAAKAAVTSATPVDSNGVISIDDFSKVDLRVALVVSAEIIPEADKLLRLKVNLGELGDRQIIAGIRAAYTPESLVGRKILVVANLAPRKMKFGMSEGMVLAAGLGGDNLFIFSPDPGAQPGQRAK